MITIRGVRKRLGRQLVLRSIDLDVQCGEVVAIIGPSGTGKSVLLRHIIGLLHPDAGDVVVAGVHVPSAPREVLYSLRRRMGYAFQDAALLDSLDVAANLRLALADHEANDDAVATARISEVLQLVNLPLAAVAKRPAQLSGGMRKRVGVARAVINRPEIVLYDEPTTGLDPANADSMHALIRRISDETGATSIVVTHDIRALGMFADRVVALANGRVVSDDAIPHRRPTWS